jgi:hypothetical protein
MAGGAGVSSAAAIAITKAEHDAPIDTALTEALENPRERAGVLGFEQTVLRFMESRDLELTFPPLSSYQRMLVHRLADRFYLEHRNVDSDPGVYRLVKSDASCRGTREPPCSLSVLVPQLREDLQDPAELCPPGKDVRDRFRAQDL